MRRALLDRVPDEEAGSRVTVVMVVGAGRAPLVRASLAAAKEAGRLVKVYAVEKNPNAVVTIQHLIESEGWQDLVGGGGSSEPAVLMLMMSMPLGGSLLQYQVRHSCATGPVIVTLRTMMQQPAPPV